MKGGINYTLLLYMGEYDDIINLPHYEPKNHPRMSMWKRAAQFAPFAALTGYEEAVREAERQNEALYEPKYDDSEKHTLFDSID